MAWSQESFSGYCWLRVNNRRCHMTFQPSFTETRIVKRAFGRVLPVTAKMTSRELD
jgi:hypothetical protein